MDLTWTLYQKGYAVRFVAGAVCYPLEPHTYGFLKNQLCRWSHGFVQNVRLHRRDILGVPFLRSAVAVSCWDAVVASLVYLLILPMAALVFGKLYFLLGYVIDIPAIVVPVVVGAVLRREVGLALVSLPSFFVLRTVNAIFFLMAIWSEFVQRRTYLVYEKGH